MGAFAAHAKYGRDHMTAAARVANPSSDAYWRRKVDPNGALPERERCTRARDAKRAYFAGLALKSAAARRQRQAQR
jgi:hypothetical protein